MRTEAETSSLESSAARLKAIMQKRGVYQTSKLSKRERRQAMPICTAFIDEMRENFGELAGIEAEENGQTVKWGVECGKTIGYRAIP